MKQNVYIRLDIFTTGNLAFILQILVDIFHVPRNLSF